MMSTRKTAFNIKYEWIASGDKNERNQINAVSIRACACNANGYRRKSGVLESWFLR